MAPSEARDLSDLVERSERRLFVGRDAEQGRFEEMLASSPADPGYRFILAIAGPSGSGKTWLVRRLVARASATGARVGLTDENELGPIEAMRKLALALQHKRRFNRFLAADRSYQELRSRVANDPAAPPGLSSSLARAASRGLVVAAKELVPGGATAIDFVGSEALVEQGEEIATYLAAKFRKREDRRLLRDPLGALTPYFTEGLRASAAKDGSHLVLCFDGYEQTSGLIDSWLRRLLTREYGALPTRLLLIIAGQVSPSASDWSRFQGVMRRETLGEFSARERTEYLERAGVVDGDHVAAVSQSSGLPAAFAASASGALAGGVGGDMADSLLAAADARFRQLLLVAALPRLLNRDTLKILLDLEDDAREAWQWLRGRTYVDETRRGWVLHPSARTPLLKRVFKESPSGAEELSLRLGDFYGEQMTRWADRASASLSRNFRELAAEHIYHRLCQDHDQHFPQALAGFARALGHDQTLAYQIAAAIDQSEHDRDIVLEDRWGADLRASASADEDWEGMARGLSRVLDYAGLDITNAQRIALLNLRAFLWTKLHHFDRALEDVDEGLAARNDDPFLLARRVAIDLAARRWEDAEQDADRALALAGDGSVALRARLLDGKARAVTRTSGFPASIDLWSAAIALSPKSAALRNNRGIAYARSGRVEDALAEFVEAAKIDPSQAQESATLDARIRIETDGVAACLPRMRQVVEMFPESQDAWLYYAGMLQKAEMGVPAAIDALMSVEVPHRPAVLGCRAVALDHLAPEAALDALREVVAGRPATADECNRLGLINARLGRTEDAAKNFADGLLVEADNLALLYNMAVLARKSEAADVAEHRDRLMQVLQRPETDAMRSLYATAGLAAVAGDKREALEALATARRLDPVVEDWIVDDPAWDGLRDDPDLKAALVQDDPAALTQDHPAAQ